MPGHRVQGGPKRATLTHPSYVPATLWKTCLSFPAHVRLFNSETLIGSIFQVEKPRPSEV